MTATIRLVNTSTTSYIYHLFFVMRTCKIYSLSKLPGIQYSIVNYSHYIY